MPGLTSSVQLFFSGGTGVVRKTYVSVTYVNTYIAQAAAASQCAGNSSILGNVHRLDSPLDIDEASILGNKWTSPVIWTKLMNS